MVSTSIPRSTSSLDAGPKYYLVEIPRRVAFTDVLSSSNMDKEDDNPFRPGSELSREAEIIVNLIKEGKPITPTGDMNNSANELQQQQQDSQIIAKRNQMQTQAMMVNSNNKNNDDNDNTNTITTTTNTTNNINNKKIINSNNNNGNLEPGQVDQVQHGIIISSTNNENMPKVEQINLKKKRKCCSVQ